jgi:hypothetical protein
LTLAITTTKPVSGYSPSLPAVQPVALGADLQRRRTAARGVQAAVQDPDGAAVTGDRGHAVLGFWALLASGQITMRKADGWQTLATKPTDPVIDLAA